jgi:hypothetical protein
MNFDEIADRIVKTEGLTFALACVAKTKPDDLREACDALKSAIELALNDASLHGARRELTRRSGETR